MKIDSQWFLFLFLLITAVSKSFSILQEKDSPVQKVIMASGYAVLTFFHHSPCKQRCQVGLNHEMYLVCLHLLQPLQSTHRACRNSPMFCVFFSFRLCPVSGQKTGGVTLAEGSSAQTAGLHWMLSSCLGHAVQEGVLHKILNTGFPSADLESVASRKGARSG